MITNGEAGAAHPGRMRRIALLGNPNTGKTTLFNRLTGLRHKTSNFPGTTLEARLGRVDLATARPTRALGGSDACCGRDGEDGDGLESAPVGETELIDLPGVYSLELDQLEARVCRDVLVGVAAPRGDVVGVPDAACVVLDGTNLGRNLMMAGEVLRRRLPTVVAVNMIDLAHRRGFAISAEVLSERLGCEVVLISARTGEGLGELRRALGRARVSSRTPPGDDAGLRAWAEEVFATAASRPEGSGAEEITDRLDRAFTHPLLGVVLFAVVMTGLFWGLFAIAAYPMAWIEWVFTWLGSGVRAVVPEGPVQELLADGVVGGIGATVVFLPQICLLFLLISLLEDTGYLARAAFVMDRVLRPFGLPGHAFVPLLSSHACALPGIMACRAIPDRRQRLATILVAPFMTCSARLPVYVLLTSILFPKQPLLAALAFVGCYALGIVAGVLTALLARRTILRGKSRPMALELPTYKAPSLRTALVTTVDRGMVFLKNAGTNILMICIVLWWLSSYPKVGPPQEADALRGQVAAMKEGLTPLNAPIHWVPRTPGESRNARNEASAARQELELKWDEVSRVEAEIQRLETSQAARESFAGRIGRAIQPVFEPLGYDWQLTIGVVTSFAAREVFVSTMNVVLAGQDDPENETIRQGVMSATRDDGVTPVFTSATSWSLLVYYVLAMQCLPTLAVTAREAGGKRWALLQLGWMSGVAYVAALIVYQIAR
ncbi:MAG: ferrous iron transporter B [Phycisphaerales bacterium]|nr:ferrous iron transporter B [Phycisphaerales bacterium]